ncbi:MAG: 2-C-methyl-D-erythritol 4-phosphate cytidylyltransferase [Chloracidobacterium sp.]|nr:2-C-methyl-D-erythritol 4-phosphate cytidylyltransferase [Chloracidobacterium sp.]
MNTAIIVAAGSGQRFAGPQPKQFVNLLGKPLIIHTLERFDACPEIDDIVLVLSEDGLDYFEQIKDKFEISNLRSIITGGKTRAESVKNALDAIDANKANIIAVHDGARPLVSVEEISRTVIKAAETGAACLVTEVTDTIKEIEEEYISCTIDRNKLRRALTPQAFRYDILQKAFDGVDLSESITDECYLVEKLGVKIALVEGSSKNIKITRAEDLILAEALLKQL